MMVNHPRQERQESERGENDRQRPGPVQAHQKSNAQDQDDPRIDQKDCRNEMAEAREDTFDGIALGRHGRELRSQAANEENAERQGGHERSSYKLEVGRKRNANRTHGTSKG